MPVYSVKNRKDWKVVALCLLAAATFWFLDAMSKSNYTSTIDYPIHINYADKSFDTSVELEIKGSGWDLIYSKMGFDIEELNYTLTSAPKENSIPTKLILKKINLPSIELLSYPDSIPLKFK